MSTLRLVPTSGSPIEITQDQTVLGRDPACEAVVADGSVSRRHARIERRGATWMIFDQGSANGTFVDSQRTAEAELKHGQELRLGAVAFTVAIEGDDSELGATIAASPAATLLQAPPPPAPKPAPPAPKPAPPAPPAPKPAPPAPPPAPAPRPAAPAPAAPAPPPPRPAAPAPVPPPPRPAAPAPPAPRPARPAPAQPMGAGGPAPAKKGKGPLFWTLTGCCGCLVLLGVIGGVLAIAIPGGIAGIFAVVDKATRPAIDTVKGMLSEVKSGELDQAYLRFSESFRARVSRDQFETLVGMHPALQHNADATFMSRSSENGVVTLKDAILVAENKEAETATFRVIEEAGQWKIDELAFGPGSSTSIPSSDPNASTPGSTSKGGLALALGGLNKNRTAKGTEIVIELNASGYASRSGPDGPQVDVIEDVETRGPDGRRLPNLSKAAIERYQGGSDSQPHTFSTTLTLDPGSNAPGSYRVLMTVHDMIGGGEASHEVTFELP